jgi:pimeloyl-ACP methyl ester carboxylesterase
MPDDKPVSDDPELEQFLEAPPAVKFEKVRDERLRPRLSEYLGQEAYDELRRIADERQARSGGHLGATLIPNMIFIPGVMGTMLSSRKGGIRWIDARTRNFLQELRLAPDGVSDAKPEYGIKVGEIDFTYMAFVDAVDARDDFNLASFPYDWRKPLTQSAAALRDLVNKVYSENGDEPIHVVAHSMGGLMLRAALAEHGDEIWPKLDRIAFVGTPHYGSPSIAGYLKNHLWGFELMALLGLYFDRPTFRSLWGVLGMLPAPRGIYPGTRDNDPAPWTGGAADDPYVHPCANFDMYKADQWKLEDLTSEDTDNLQKALDAARDFHRTLYESHDGLKQEQRDRMAAIAGVGYETLFRLSYEQKFWGYWERTSKETGRIVGDPHRDGDGRVPVASAALENVGELRYVRGVHGDLPMIAEVYEDVFRWLKHEPMKLPDTPQGAFHGHLGSGTATPDAPSITRVTNPDHVAGKPGFWSPEPDPQQLKQYRELLESEQLPAFNKVRLL